MKNFSAIKIIFLLKVLLLSVFVNSCKTPQPAIDEKDLSYLYNPVKKPFSPRYNVYNESDVSSTLTIKFFPNDLFFSEANPQGVPIAAILITVKLFNISQGNKLADTASFNLSIVKEKGKLEYLYNLPLKVENGTEYMTEIRILDRLRLLAIQSFVPFNTLSYTNKYNFRALGHFEKNELFSPVLRVNEYVNLLYNRTKADSLYISYYKPFTEVPDPPSLLLPEKTLDYPPEKTVVIPYSAATPLMFPREGIYLCSVGRDIHEGFTFLNMGVSFPTMNDPKVMIEPLAYISSSDEINEMRSAENAKMALDNFWIKCGGNVEKARELIRIYYTRVLYANYYFTSYKEGWMSERGMIYIIYGPPDKIYKTPEGENWGYRKPVVQSAWGGRYTVSDEYIFFYFKKRDNIYSDNDYFISRTETLVTYWDKAVASWRKGIVFRLDNPGGI